MGYHGNRVGFDNVCNCCCLQWHQRGRHPSQHKGWYQALHAARGSGRDAEQKSLSVVHHGGRVQLWAHSLGDRSALHLRRCEWQHMVVSVYRAGSLPDPFCRQIVTQMHHTIQHHCLPYYTFVCVFHRDPWGVPAALSRVGSNRPFLRGYERGGLHQETTAILS